MVSLPPLLIASRELTTRFSTTCSSCPGSAFIARAIAHRVATVSAALFA